MQRKQRVAAITIQRWFRRCLRDGYVTRRMRLERKAVLIIQRKARVWKFKKCIARAVHQRQDRSATMV